MQTSLRDKVLAVFATYSEAGTIREARQKHGLRAADFYAAMRDMPDLRTVYLQIQEARADMMVDEAYAISTDESADPRRARVAADIRLKIAAAYDRGRFGEKLDVQVDQKVSVVGALELAKSRSLRPVHDLNQVTDAQYVELPVIPRIGATDSQSDAPPVKAPNPFDD